MTEQTNNDTKQAVQDEEGQTETKNVSRPGIPANKLTIYGNHFSPKIENEEEKPTYLELRIRCARLMVQPYLEPIIGGISRTSDFLSVGVAHTKSTIDRIGLSQNHTIKSIFIASGGLVGLALARKRGVFKKTLYGVLGFNSAAAACYPEKALEYSNIAMFIAKEKLPTIIKSAHSRLGSSDNKNNDEAKKS